MFILICTSVLIHKIHINTRVNAFYSDTVRSEKHKSDIGSMMHLTSGFFLNFISKPRNHGRIRKT